MVHQRRHGIDFCIAARTRQSIGHIVPLVGGGAEVGREVIIGVLDIIDYTVTIIREAAIALGGVVMVFHHLRRGGRHTARNGTIIVATIGGAETIVERRLVPGGGHQGGHGTAEGRQRHRTTLQHAPLLGRT